MRLIAVLMTFFSALCFATGVFAHASLVSAEPGDGSVLPSAPKEIRLQFDEAVTPAVIRLIDAGEHERADIGIHAAGDTIVVTLPEKLPRGTQVVSYRVVSQDGHPVGGSLMFSIGAPTRAANQPETSRSLQGLIWLARIGVYLGLFAGVGGAFFNGWIGYRPLACRAMTNVSIAGLFGAVFSLGLQGLDLLALGLFDLLSPAPWKAALATSVGPSLLIAMAAMVAGLIAQACASRKMARGVSAVAMMTVGLSLVASGHAASASPHWLSRPGVFLHGMAVAFWVGALMPLLAMVRKPAANLLTVLDRFSRAAVPVVAVLVLTGLLLAIMQLESFHALIGTRYGIILSVKLVLVVALLGLAALNRFYLTPRLDAGLPNARRLGYSIAAECVIAVAILAVVAGWRFTPPPRALAAAAITPLAIHIHTEKAMFQVLVSPGTVGTDSFVLQLMAGDASPLPAQEATLTLSLPERGIEPLERAAVLGADGYWHVSGVPIPFAGRWHMRIDARVTDFEKVTLEDDLDVPAQ